MRFSTEERNSGIVSRTLNKKAEWRKELTVAFESKLKKIKENDEIPLKSSEKKKKTLHAAARIRRKDERPKSAGCSPRRKLELGCRKRSKSTESFWGDTGKGDFGVEMKKKQKQMFQVREMSCPSASRYECSSLLDLDSKCSSLCGIPPPFCVCDYETHWWMTYDRCKGETRRRSSSTPNFTNEFFEKEKDLQKVKRSLKLIGLELSDLGVYSKSRGVISTTPRHRIKQKSSTLSTRLTGRRISLKSLREDIKKAWLDDRLDKSHKKLISQAAYEEWYFKKEKELRAKQEEKRQRKAEAQENLRKELERKKAQAEEEFRKWTQRKRIKRKEKENLVKRSEDGYGRTRKTKEDSEAAFLKWKKEKDKELEKKMLERKKEKEQKMMSERQKIEKKKIAEKAFQQWKIKLEESEKLEEKKKQRLKRKQEELKKRQEQEGGSQISFQIWKKLKDEEIHRKLKQFWEVTRLEKEERQVRLEEKMYEAEQAFEDWLEKIDVRKQKQFCVSFQNIPWIPV